MGKQFQEISEKHKSFIEKQKLFFVGTAAQSGKVNISPKGTDSLRVIDSNKVVWHNLTGSGNETAAHLLLNNRMTIMFCSFEKNPMIMRLYGQAKIFHPRDEEYHKHIDQFPQHHGSRQIIVMDIEMLQTSCGFAVPLMDFQKERGTLDDWALKKGRDGVEDYWKEKNTRSLDNFETKILGD